jgi:hypothetical protein
MQCIRQRNRYTVYAVTEPAQNKERLLVHTSPDLGGDTPPSEN